MKRPSNPTRVPARCNKRACQARRNLSKMPEQYVRWPKCHHAGCDGLMYVDNYRLNRGAKDYAPTCYDDCRHYPHPYTDKACKHYDEWTIDRSLEPRSKHSPHPTDDEAPF